MIAITADEKVHHATDRDHVPIADGGHKNNVAVEQFDPIIFVKNADLAEFMVLLDRELIGFGAGAAHDFKLPADFHHRKRRISRTPHGESLNKTKLRLSCYPHMNRPFLTTLTVLAGATI